MRIHMNRMISVCFMRWAFPPFFKEKSWNLELKSERKWNRDEDDKARLRSSMCDYKTDYHLVIHFGFGIEKFIALNLWLFMRRGVCIHSFRFIEVPLHQVKSSVYPISTLKSVVRWVQPGIILNRQDGDKKGKRLELKLKTLLEGILSPWQLF